ncbi:glycoside hydrolase family 15 protein [Reyranella sp. CPCC 100927]|uniref:glycoside hydrolase family 15 protein n=1 Tax=Reyranella sp. CPCC 100927 TaxID=2599616 RepID=UPI0011B60E4B|nr:glycoside hydrolase family 15 protein [Reyranella sp. CPCC 100927]TWT15442.1 glycoside hydrolase family 15 protein [Reyranella sp. CPCC 100927]
MALKIEDYALIGDGETAALVGRDGSIDWLCLPRFDSDACFTALLGTPDHGRWLLAPVQPARVSRRYRDDTLILETRFATDSGIVTVIDFMPPRDPQAALIRLVVGVEGRVPMRTELVLRFGYGATVPWVTRMEDGALRAVAGPDMALLRTPVALRGEDLRTVAEFVVTPGDTIPFVLTYCASNQPITRQPINPRAALATTEAFWQRWAAQCKPAGEWSGAVKRSLITLKALIYTPTGGIVAAPTTSLPERLGGTRNWDYRFCWLRDATLTLLALMNAGYYEEAQAWRGWLLRAIAGVPAQAQIMYGVGGERRLTEWAVGWLPGYENSAPVRIGNAAHNQLQLDVYGEVMDALHQARRVGLDSGEAAWGMQRALIEHLTKIWDQPDTGIWEVRDAPEHFTYSKVMAWVALDRAVKGAEMFGLEAPIKRWRQLAQTIHDDICANGFDPQLGSFVRAYGARELDASLLLLPAVGFLPPSDPRIRGTVDAIERHLLVDGFVLRYDTTAAQDGLPPGEGAFLACSFWLADAYVLMGRPDDARRLFERLLALRNDVGLLSEEYDVVRQRLVGNFPQAFSHIALVNTAYNLTQVQKPVEQRARRNGGDAESTPAQRV